jgi:hypothetical protein
MVPFHAFLINWKAEVVLAWGNKRAVSWRTSKLPSSIGSGAQHENLFPILSYSIQSYSTLSHTILSYLNLSHSVSYYPISFHLILSYLFPSYPILSYPVSSYPILSHPILPYLSLYYCVFASFNEIKPQNEYERFLSKLCQYKVKVTADCTV